MDELLDFLQVGEPRFKLCILTLILFHLSEEGILLVFLQVVNIGDDWNLWG